MLLQTQQTLNFAPNTSYMAFPGIEVRLLKKLAPNKSAVALDNIKNAVYEFYHIELDHPDLKSRKELFVLCRQLIMYFAKKYTFLSQNIIGSSFGKDHSTVTHSLKTINNALEVDKKFKKLFLELEGRVITAIKK